MLNLPNTFGKYKCPCCRFYTLEREAGNTFQLCFVCYWEDDGIQLLDEDYEGGANAISLRQARFNFQAYGAIDCKFITVVRRPLFYEQPSILDFDH